MEKWWHSSKGLGAIVAVKWYDWQEYLELRRGFRPGLGGVVVVLVVVEAAGGMQVSVAVHVREEIVRVVVGGTVKVGVRVVVTV